MSKNIYKTIIILLNFYTGIAQNITGKIIDSKTGQGIPYANVIINNSENLVSNTEGYFTISENDKTDSAVIAVSYLGYVDRKITITELKKLALTIALDAGVVELQAVIVSNVRPNPLSIMAEVKKNLTRNYKSDGLPVKNKVFFRESNSLKPSKLKLEITKSTGYANKDLQEVNTQINAFTSKLITNPPVVFSDMYCNYYTNTTKKDDKLTFLSKLQVLKATRLKDKNNSSSLDDIRDKTVKMLLQHLDTTKYYRMKSGWFGSHDTISLRENFHMKKKPSQLFTTKSDLCGFIFQNNFLNSDRLTFINQPEIYDYAYEGAIYSKENEFVYVLTFKPRKSKAKYTGKLYISETDFAVLRAEYALAEGEAVSGFNMKFLLGIKQSENASKGTIIYKQNSSGLGYYLQYANIETGQYIYVNRPLKLIELSNDERDVLAFDLKVEITIKTKKEYLNILKSESTEIAINNLKEEDFKYLNLKHYDPNIWKDFGAIEPLEEMKQFQARD